MPAVHRFRHTGQVRVLVVEDETVLADAIVTGLRREALAVDVAYDGAEGLDRALLNDYDVIVLDRDLPTVHGDDICRAVAKEQPATKILMLTASAGVSSRVEGLSIGADDYLTKPFAFVELVARVRALGRRSRDSVPPILERSGIRLDPARRVVERDNVPMALTRKEFGVLEELLRAGGAVVSSEHLLEKVWDENIDPFSNVLRTSVMTLRRKLGEPAVIDTVAGIGYQL